MNILITGANGQLGSAMRKVTGQSLDSFYFTDVVIAPESNTSILDITDLEAIRTYVKEKEIQVIVNCAAWTNVDKAETEEEMAMRLNAIAPRNLAQAMKEVGGLLVHISTDYVFGKEPYNTPCNELQKGTPTGVYGYTKLCGEKNIIETEMDYVILRTAWLYSEFGNNFCKTMMRLTKERPQINVVFDQVGTPTYAGDLACAIMTILNDYRQTGASSVPYPRKGIYHYSNEGVCSWYDFAYTIAQLSHHDSCQVMPCHSSEFPSPVTRPSYSVLDKTKIKETFGIHIPHWSLSLKKCIEQIKKTEDNE